MKRTPTQPSAGESEPGGMCPEHKLVRELRPKHRLTKEAAWCGTWYDCPNPGCFKSVLIPGEELRAEYERLGLWPPVHLMRQTND
jgi:hypothetical protein